MTKFWSQNFHSIYVPSELRVSKNLLGSFIAKIVTSQKFGVLILLFRNPLREYFFDVVPWEEQKLSQKGFWTSGFDWHPLFQFLSGNQKKKKKETIWPPKKSEEIFISFVEFHLFNVISLS